MSDPTWLEVAKAELGVREIPGPKSNPRIIEYDKHTTLKATSDEVPWCAAFVNFCLDTAGVPGTHLANARSFLHWGAVIVEPILGCIVVFRRGNNPMAGHVAFYIEDVGEEFIRVLGGNQGDKVSYSIFAKHEILGYRMPQILV